MTVVRRYGVVGQIWTFRDGLVVGMRDCGGWEDAFDLVQSEAADSPGQPLDEV